MSARARRAAGVVAGFVATAAVLAGGAVATGAVGPGGSGDDGVGGNGVRTIEITIRHSRFTPAVLEASPGARLRFVVRNLDPIAHELIVGERAVQDRHERGTEAHHAARPGEVSVAAGATAVTTFVMPLRSAPTGPVFLGCHLPGHWDYGMQGILRLS